MKNVVLCLALIAVSISSSAANADENKYAPLAEKSPNRTQVEFDEATALDYAHAYYEDDDEDDAEAQAAVPPASDLWARMVENAWPDTLTPFTARFQPGKSYVTLYKKFPFWPIDMRSPDRLKRSMAAKELANKSSIGHMSVGWSCVANGETKRSEGFAAQTGEDGGQSAEMMDSGWAGNAMIATFTDGRIQNGYNVQRYFSTQFINHMSDKKDVPPFFALVIEVPTTDCEHVREFVKSYVLHPSKPWKNFGMLPDPNKFEGGGCGSFAISALSHAPSLAPILNTFWRTLPVPEKILGLRTKAFLPNEVIPFSYAKMISQERPISKVKVVLKNWDEGKVALNLHLVDPELTIYSFRKFTEIAERTEHPRLTRYQIEHLDKLKRTYNFGSSNSRDYPNDDKDSGYQEIDASFDPSFAKVSDSVEQWWSTHQSTQHLHVVSIPFGVGVMVDSAR